jgi:hypothetical protein
MAPVKPWGTELLAYGGLAGDQLRTRMWNMVSEMIRDLEEPLTRVSAGRFAAQLGLVACYRSFDFEQRDERSTALRDGIRRNRMLLDEVAPRAKQTIDAIERSEPVDRSQIDGLMTATHARTYLQGLADTAVDEIESGSEGSDWVANLDLLAVLAAYVELPRETVRRWAGNFDRDSDSPAERVRAAACHWLVSSCDALS